MSLYLRWGGALLLLLSAIFLGREYSRYTKRREGEMAAFCDLLLHIKGQISRFLAPTSELLSGFDSPELLECGFLGEFEKSSDLALALAASKTTLGEKFSAIVK